MLVYCLVLSALAAWGGDDQVSLKEVGISLPKIVSGLEFKKRHQFDTKELGYSVTYANGMSLIMLYVYDAGEKKIPNGKANALVTGQLKGALDNLKLVEKSGSYRNVRPLKGDLPLPKSVKEKFAAAGFTFEVKGNKCKGYVLVVGKGNQFLKIRVTQYVVANKTNDAEVNGFLEAVAKAIK
jgi:hypothetical protein